MGSDSWGPVIYEENGLKVLKCLREGEVEYPGLGNWSYQERFFWVCGASYPSLRKRDEVPAWIPYRTHNNEHDTHAEEIAVLADCGIWKACPVRLDLILIQLHLIKTNYCELDSGYRCQVAIPPNPVADR